MGLINLQVPAEDLLGKLVGTVLDRNAKTKVEVTRSNGNLFLKFDTAKADTPLRLLQSIKRLHGDLSYSEYFLYVDTLEQTALHRVWIPNESLSVDIEAFADSIARSLHSEYQGDAACHTARLFRYDEINRTPIKVDSQGTIL